MLRSQPLLGNRYCSKETPAGSYQIAGCHLCPRQVDQRTQQNWMIGAQLSFVDCDRLSKQLYGRDIPYVLLMHVGAFDAHMLPKLIALFRQKGFTFVTLQKAQSDPVYRFDPDIGYPGGGTLEELVSKVKGVNYPDNSKPYKELEKICR